MDFLKNEYVAFFAIVALGILLGKVKIKGISLDTSAIIFVALLFGHYGIKMPDILQKFGLIFFIYSVGIQAGPGFFESFKKDGLRLIFVTVLAVGSGAIVTMMLARLLNIETDLAVGIFAGAMTSTPGLAAAIESTSSTLAPIGYGIAYPFGVLAVILFVKVSPKIFNVSIAASEAEYEQDIKSDFPGLINKNFVVENVNIFGRSLGELRIRSMTHCNISRILHDDQAFTPTESSLLHKGDVVKAVGTEADLMKVQLLIGNETDVPIPLNEKYVIQTILVTNESAINKPLDKLGLMEQYNATITSMRRAGIDITPDSATQLRFGDKVKVACAEESLINVKKMLGDNHKRMTELDFLPVSIGILLGLIIGEIHVPLLGFNFNLGLTGGVLTSAIILSRIGKTGHILWNVSGSSNQLLRNIGLIFFLVSVGTNAGGSLLATIQSGGVKLLLVGVAVTIIPMVVAMTVGHFFMKINFLVLLGTLTGSMTSTPALSAVEPMSESNGPKIAYATVYPFALVLIIICCQLIGFFSS